MQSLHDDTKSSTTGIPGVISSHVNESATRFKCCPWTEIVSLLGRSGDSIMRHLLLDCGVFVRIAQGKDNLHQVCGIPVSELLNNRKLPGPSSNIGGNPIAGEAKKGSCAPRSPGSITFVRSRILYARPSLNSQGGVRFGMKHIHVLNRYSDLTDSKQSVHIMKYVFPLQFRLHNVFTSVVDRNETAQEFKDYTLREHEITYAENRLIQQSGCHSRPSGAMVPKRLRGEPVLMIQAIRKRHSKCSYTQLLRHHCPVRAADSCASILPAATESQQSLGRLRTQLSSFTSTISRSLGRENILGRPQPYDSILVYATPTAHVSAFCRAVVEGLLPGGALGTGEYGKHNLTVLLSQIDHFVRMRRYENLSLHEVSQNLRINRVSWLRPLGISSNAKLSQTDRKKRVEIFLELLYYIFDSVLIPLIRSHFYVTESNVHRNRLFYFRHDVWRRVSEPSLTDLRFTIFQGLATRDLRQARHSRLLGHSQVRLLPKEFGARPIVNLRRKLVQKQNGKLVLSQNINSRLMPCFATLNYERSLQPHKLGSALFSIGEAHKRLRDFRGILGSVSMKQLYFVKMDVKSCFDTIPQDQMVLMVQGLLSEHRYHVGKHAELKSIDGRCANSTTDRPLVRFPHSARPTETPPGLSYSMLSRLAEKRSRTVFVDLWDSRTWDSRSVLKLLQEHVQRNVVKIDKRFFKQINGIPQGSVLSSLLCNFFYGAFENSSLGFLRPGESLLLRLIDDFLLITTNQDHARRFAQVMVDGNAEYGITVNTKKSLANFETKVNKTKIPRLHGSNIFPYCGMAVDVNTLEISKFRGSKDAEVSNGLTIELCRRQGLKFHRKVLDSLKIQMSAMLLDTKLSSRYCVSSNLYQNFMEAGMKMYRYVRGLPKNKRPSEAMVVDTWKDVVNLAVKMTRGKRGTKTIDEYECAVSKTQMHWLAAAALEQVMRRKQTGYQSVLHWVQGMMDRCQAGMKVDSRRLRELRDDGGRVFQRFRY
jgi:telomerase reverse transcriptase